MENQDALIKALKEYNQLLLDELLETVPLAARCGWKSTRFEAGVAAREKITKLEYEKIGTWEYDIDSGTEEWIPAQ